MLHRLAQSRAPVGQNLIRPRAGDGCNGVVSFSGEHGPNRRVPVHGFPRMIPRAHHRRQRRKKAIQPPSWMSYGSASLVCHCGPTLRPGLVRRHIVSGLPRVVRLHHRELQRGSLRKGVRMVPRRSARRISHLPAFEQTKSTLSDDHTHQQCLPAECIGSAAMSTWWNAAVHLHTHTHPLVLGWHYIPPRCQTAQMNCWRRPQESH